MSNIPNPALFRRLERKLVGMVMAVMAWLLEKVVLRSVIRSSRKAKS